jgi:hypothetical protein
MTRVARATRETSSPSAGCCVASLLRLADAYDARLRAA